MADRVVGACGLSVDDISDDGAVTDQFRSRSAVEWEQHLNEIGVANGGIVDAPYGSGLSFRDPDNIALEFFAPPG